MSNDYEVWNIGGNQVVNTPAGPQYIFDFDKVVAVGLTKEDALSSVTEGQKVVHKNVQGVWEIVEA